MPVGQVVPQPGACLRPQPVYAGWMATYPHRRSKLREAVWSVQPPSLVSDEESLRSPPGTPLAMQSPLRLQHAQESMAPQPSTQTVYG